MSETPWLDEREMRAWLRLIAVVQLLPGALEGELQQDAQLTHFEYFTLAILSEAPERTLRMTALADSTNATLPRLSHVIRRLEDRGLVRRGPCPTDGRATNAHLTEAGWDVVVAAAPGHVATVRRHVFDVLTPEQVGQLDAIGTSILRTLDPENRLSALDDVRDQPLPR
ncbi:MarR family winged helix-turn-helix transcriptional regulator [Mycetocola spongiae]|uniref:MarR family winged helix-turn-helix transcriptional regulator n=1 Tax=Mycetocola spongiae TaxID=2859226 RepID=UPI001CF243D7|nr:MarR family transcriptional regulator [Mycetocola spongiae]UCR88265.1 MarR family transcriptional regulator [Mycetocola spongiae]